MRGQIKTLVSGLKHRATLGQADARLDSFELVDKKVTEDAKGFAASLAIVRSFREEFLDRRCRNGHLKSEGAKSVRHDTGLDWDGWLGETDIFHARENQYLFRENDNPPSRNSTGKPFFLDSPWFGFQLKPIPSGAPRLRMTQQEVFIAAARDRAYQLGEKREWKGWHGETEALEAGFENGLLAHFQVAGFDFMREQDQVFEREVTRESKFHVHVQVPTYQKQKPVRVQATPTEHCIRLRKRASLKIFSQMTGQSLEALQEAADTLFDDRMTPAFILTESQQELLCEHFGLACKPAPEPKFHLDTGTDLRSRSPVACVMGHVDHGKTTLLDALRRTEVAKREMGGITQSIGAFTVTHNQQCTTFLDTPGHAAFGAMRARGASKHLTDIIVLVVSVDAGVQVQTKEAIRLARKNNVPLVVAISKCDLDMDPRAVRKQLLAEGVQVESEGGDVLAVNISAKTGEGLDELVEAIDLAAQMLELKVPFDGPAEAALIELRLVKGSGVVAHGIVRKGTMKVGDYFVCGRKYGQIKQLLDESGKNRILEAPPSTPVGIVGLGMEFEAVLEEDFSSVPTEAIARQIVSEREAEHAVLLQTEKRLLGDDFLQPSRGLSFKVIIKADVRGSVMAFVDYLQSLPSDLIKIEVIRSGLGDVSLADIEFAKRLDAHVYGFGVSIVRAAEHAAQQSAVPVFCHPVIFQLIDSLKDTLGGMLPPQEATVLHGIAEVRRKIDLNKGRSKLYCAGCVVKQGELRSGGIFRVRRDDDIVHEGPLLSLQHFKDKVSLVEKGSECSLSLKDFDDFQPGDLIECVTVELKRQIFDDGRTGDGNLRREKVHAFA